MIATMVFVLRADGWRVFGGPGFTDDDKAREWCMQIVEDESLAGYECVSAAIDAVTGELLHQVRARLVVSRN